MKIRFRCEIPIYKKLSFTDSGIRININQGIQNQKFYAYLNKIK